MAIQGTVKLPKLDGVEISPGIILIGEPQSQKGTDRLRCLANVCGMLAVVELRIRFRGPSVPPPAEVVG